MKDFLSIIKIKGFNKRCLTETDFFDFCDQESIKILEADVPTSFYFKCEGKPFIVIKKSLKGLKRLFEMWHEIAHYCAHGGRSNEEAFFFGMLECKNEFEADAFAVIALCPLTALTDLEFLENHPNIFAKKIYKERQRLFFLYGI